MAYTDLDPLSAFATVPSTWLAQLLENTEALHDGTGRQAGIGCRVSVGSAQNIANSTNTKINFDTEALDIGSDFDTGNSRFVAPITGFYLVALNVQVNDLSQDAQVLAKVYVDGAEIASSKGYTPVANGDPSASTTVLCQVTAGQHVEGYVLQTSGATEALATAATETYMSIAFMGTT